MLTLLAAIVGIVFVVLGLVGTIALSHAVAISLICVLACELTRAVEGRVRVGPPA